MMKKNIDPRLATTRKLALETALDILQQEGVLAVTHASVSKATGISRSTLYRHWPKVDRLRNDTFNLSATFPQIAPKTNGPLRADLTGIMGNLITALNETPWGQIAPQVVAVAATDKDARLVINNLMKERIAYVKAVFAEAAARGELLPDASTDNLAEMAIAVPYFRKLIAGLPLNREWLDSHVDMLCRLAEAPVQQSNS